MKFSFRCIWAGYVLFAQKDQFNLQPNQLWTSDEIESINSKIIKKIESITELFLIKIRAKDSLKEVSKNIFLSKWANGFFSNTQIS